MYWNPLLDFVILDVEMLDETDLFIYLWKQKVLAHIVKGGPASHLHDVRKFTPSLIPDDGLEVVHIDPVWIHIVDDVEEVLDGWTIGIDPGKRLRRHFDRP